MNESIPPPESDATTGGIEAFKHAFRRHAAGVAVVTASLPDGRPVGFTATSLASLSAVPPLATFNMARSSSAWPAMTVGNNLAIHTLGPRSKYLAELMAADHDHRFDGDHWHRGQDGLPILDGVTAWMVGTIIGIYPVHSSAVVVVQVRDGDLGDEDDALLYHERQYLRPTELGPPAAGTDQARPR